MIAFLKDGHSILEMLTVFVCFSLKSFNEVRIIRQVEVSPLHVNAAEANLRHVRNDSQKIRGQERFIEHRIRHSKIKKPTSI